jgi:hypothetical protein
MEPPFGQVQNGGFLQRLAGEAGTRPVQMENLFSSKRPETRPGKQYSKAI